MTKPKQSAFDSAVKMLASRTNDSVSLNQKLRNKGFDLAEIEQALLRVKSLGYFDDVSFAKGRAFTQLKKGFSAASVAQKLEQEGRDSSVVSRVASELNSTDEERAKQLLSKRKLTKAKAIRLLASRGYDEDLVFKLTEDLPE
jgi:regulatory protein